MCGRGPAGELLEPALDPRRTRDTMMLTRANHPGRVGEIGEQAQPDEELGEFRLDVVLLATPECVVVGAEELVGVPQFHERAGVPAMRRMSSRGLEGIRLVRLELELLPKPAGKRLVLLVGGPRIHGMRIATSRY